VVGVHCSSNGSKAEPKNYATGSWWDLLRLSRKEEKLHYILGSLKDFTVSWDKLDSEQHRGKKKKRYRVEGTFNEFEIIIIGKMAFIESTPKVHNDHYTAQDDFDLTQDQYERERDDYEYEQRRSRRHYESGPSQVFQNPLVPIHASEDGGSEELLEEGKIREGSATQKPPQSTNSQPKEPAQPSDLEIERAVAKALSRARVLESLPSSTSTDWPPKAETEEKMEHFVNPSDGSDCSWCETDFLKRRDKIARKAARKAAKSSKAPPVQGPEAAPQEFPDFRLSSLPCRQQTAKLSEPFIEKESTSGGKEKLKVTFDLRGTLTERVRTTRSGLKLLKK
jgi:hypothetical protein